MGMNENTGISSESFGLYAYLKYRENPFSRYSAEEEKDYIGKIFYEARYYKSLYNELRSNNSRFIFGGRGSGKSALIFKLKDDLGKSKIFPIIIDEFNGIPYSDNKINILTLFINELIKNFVAFLAQSKSNLNKLNKIEKEKLSFFIEEFFETISKTEFEKAVDKVSNFKKKNLQRRIANLLFNKPFNYILSTSVEVISDVVKSSLGLSQSDKSKFYKSYIPEFKEIQVNSKKTEDTKADYSYKSLKVILNDLCYLIKKSGFNGVTILIDKIDEYHELSGNKEKIITFYESWLKDNNLLMADNYSLGITIWNQIKHPLNKRGVRFDKIKLIDITWDQDDLIKILQKRLDYFSQLGVAVMHNLFDDIGALDRILILANNSPRDLIRIISTIYDEQQNLNFKAKSLSRLSVERGIARFIINYDYDSFFPIDQNIKFELGELLNYLSKIEDIEFNYNYLNNKLKMSEENIDLIISIWEKYELVKKEVNRETGVKLIKVIDPKIRYIILRKMRNIFE